jgi:maleylpyruvate isomerase
MRGGEIFLSAQLSALAGSGISEPSLLPGWTRAHVISHLAGNARGLLNLLAWARTGVETPMYPSPQARRDAIEQDARLPAAALIGESGASSAALAAAVAQMPGLAWQNTVRSALGRTIPASEVPWMRTREAWIHSVDLDAGAWFDAFPAALVDRLLTEVAGMRAGQAECPAVTLAPDDRARAWALGPAESAVTVSGTAADLLGWAIGRPRRGLPVSITSREPLPRLPRWL